LRRKRATFSANKAENVAVYIYQQDSWPHFQWKQAALAEQLAAVSRHQGRLIGRMEALGLNLRAEAVLETLT